jgi:HlyD family secretion protein
VLKKIFSKKNLKWVIAALVLVVGGVAGFAYWRKKQSALSPDIAMGNGRIEGTQVDIGPKEPLRVKQVFVEEGALVRPGQLLVQLDTVTIEAERTEAEAQIRAAEEKLAFVKASIVKQQSELKLAATEVRRSTNLVAEGAGSQRELDVRVKNQSAASASVAEAEASLATAKQAVEVARANAATIQTRIDDATLRSPVTGRVLHRLAEPGEVVHAGGKAMTLVNLEDVYMEIYLPSEQAGRVQLGAEGRITVDYDPRKAVAGYVSFVAPEAQFTPKQVETRTERDKLMFRVKIQLPKETAEQYLERIKTGVRGVGYVKLSPTVAWPDRLQAS